MRLHLFWIDNNWQERGYGKNYNLVVNMENKTYKVYTTPFYDYNSPEDIEVKRKSDITEYIKYLEKNGFTEVDEIAA